MKKYSHALDTFKIFKLTGSNGIIKLLDAVQMTKNDSIKLQLHNLTKYLLFIFSLLIIIY